MSIRILCLSGSLRSSSSNTAILKAAMELAPASCEMVLFDGLDRIPHFNPDRESEHLPDVEHFGSELRKSHALIVCSPEYAHGIPGTLKNALDWIVGTAELDQMPIGIINATPMFEAKSFAQESLVEILKTMSGDVSPETTLGISKVKSKLDQQNKLIDETTKSEITKLLEKLVIKARLYQMKS